MRLTPTPARRFTLDQPGVSRRVSPVQAASNRLHALSRNGGRYLGSGKFILTQTVVFALWIAVNAALQFHYVRHDPGCLRIVSGVPKYLPIPRCQTAIKPFDPYPMGLLTLILSVQAATCVPLILMSQNHQRDRDAVNLNSDRAQRRRGDEDRQYLLEQLMQARLVVEVAPTRADLQKGLADFSAAYLAMAAEARPTDRRPRCRQQT
ncbi:Uncharacterized membrane protein [Frankineae bacterium MT45]|nr:Uncharacterized membrane protein [Frankineae bacterium MT45]